MPRIVMQGGFWGPIQCSNSIDVKNEELVKVPILSMVDDKLAVSACGHDSLSLNAHINAQIELKKLEFHTPDASGKTKCHKMHVGPTNRVCPDLKVHESSMIPVEEDTYLGDLVRADGKNTLNIKHRVSKGLGIISQIMRILETISFGKSYFQIALSLREAMFINGILTNVEIWYGLTKAEIEQLELVDRLLLRRIFSLPLSTCTEALYLESDCQDIDTIVKGRRVKYLHNLVNSDEDSMLYKFFKAQWEYPVRGDWVLQCKQDLEDFNLPNQLDYFEGKSKDSFKAAFNRKTKDYVLDKFNDIKMSHSKMENLFYYEMKLQEYLKLAELSVDESKLIILWRLRMAKFARNYGQKNKLCPLCSDHEDTQEKSFQCKKVIKAVEMNVKYNDLFRNPTKKMAKVLKKIMQLRENQT